MTYREKAEWSCGKCAAHGSDGIHDPNCKYFSSEEAWLLVQTLVAKKLMPKEPKDGWKRVER